MSINIYESEVESYISVRPDLKKTIKIVDGDFFFSKLMESFPYKGSKIDCKKKIWGQSKLKVS